MALSWWEIIKLLLKFENIIVKIMLLYKVLRKFENIIVKIMLLYKVLRDNFRNHEFRGLDLGINLAYLQIVLGVD